MTSGFLAPHRLSILATGTLLCLGAFVTMECSAGEISLGLPVDCSMGTDCFVQNHFDHDPSERFRDYNCGSLTYNGHTGTDFRVRDLPAMFRGVAVIAASHGKVSAFRDGEPDIPVTLRGKEALKGRDAGNAVVLDHPGGWQTQYSHLLKGSVQVVRGQEVTQGQRLGLIGESGNADFPHVDFTVRLNGAPVDPFAPTAGNGCGNIDPSSSLWSPDARQALQYRPTGLLRTGFSYELPSRIAAESDSATHPMLDADAPQIFFWTEWFGAQDGDDWQMAIVDPSGSTLASGRGRVSGNKAILITGVGRKRAAPEWSPGRYVGEARLIRGGLLLLDGEDSAEVR